MHNQLHPGVTLYTQWNDMRYGSAGSSLSPADRLSGSIQLGEHVLSVLPNTHPYDHMYQEVARTIAGELSERALDAHPRFRAPWDGGDPVQALADLNRAFVLLQSVGESPSALQYERRATMQLHAGRPEQAIEDATAAIKIQDGVGPRHLRARACHEVGDLDLSMADLRAAMKATDNAKEAVWTFDLFRELNPGRAGASDAKRDRVVARYAAGERDLRNIVDDLSWTDLSNISLAGANLEGVTLNYCDLTGTDLTNTNLTLARLRHCFIHGTIFGDRPKIRAVLAGATLNGATLYGAKLYGSDLSGVKAEKGVILDRMQLEHGDLSGADLRGASLKGANLLETCCCGTRFCGANMEGIQLTRALLEEADLQDTWLGAANFQQARLSKAKLDGARLDGASLFEADAQKVSLRNASLRGVNLAQASLYGSDLTGAELHNATLVNTDLTGATITTSQLLEVHTMGPDVKGVPASTLSQWYKHHSSR